MDKDLLAGALAFLAPEYHARMVAQEKEEEKFTFKQLQKAGGALAWDDMHTPFNSLMYVKASSWKPVLLFDTPVMRGSAGQRMSELTKSTCVVRCPGDPSFAYANHRLPKGIPLSIVQGRKKGHVYFTGDIINPVLFQFREYAYPQVWMGLTPMEVFTQRKAVKMAKGTVVVAGLGLGWLLNKICEKPSVERVIMVEKNAALLDWLRPVLCAKFPAIAEKVSDWICDDIYNVLEGGTFTGDPQVKFLLDIWPSYNEYDRKFEHYKKALGNRLWGWGQMAYS